MLTLAQLHEGIRAADDVLSKTLGLDVMQQAARIESLLHEYLDAEWRLHADEAIELGMVALRSVDSRDHVDDVVAAVGTKMGQWASTVEGQFGASLKDTYQLGMDAIDARIQGRTETIKYRPVKKAKARIIPSFTLADERALEALKTHQLFWIGDHYSQNVSRRVAEAVRGTMLERGEARAAAAEEMRNVLRTTLRGVKIPTGWNGTSTQYLEGLTANAATTARVAGKVAMLARYEAEEYVIAAWNDDRTCEVCSGMDGHTFTVREGSDQLARVLAAKTKEDVQAAHPWLKGDSFRSLSGDARGLARAGFNLPPFHVKCRCTIDIA